MSALAEELRAVLRDELDTIEQRAERAAERAVLRVLEKRDADAVGGLNALAQWGGWPTADAARKAVARDPELGALATKTKGGKRRWRRSECLALFASRRDGAR